MSGVMMYTDYPLLVLTLRTPMYAATQLCLEKFAENSLSADTTADEEIERL